MKTLFTAIAVLLAPSSAMAIVIPMVPVGDPGNPADTRYLDSVHPNGTGAVSYAFDIGKYEITNAQYVAFLNSVAATDRYGDYNTGMTTPDQAGIVRNGAPGTYKYAVKPPALNGTYFYDNKPIVDVTWPDAARFANWLNNGQPVGTENASTTEDGAYTLNGLSENQIFEFNSVKRNAGARWWIPSVDEWYKAAYYNPATSTYFDWPTRSNTLPDDNGPANDTGNSANIFSAAGSIIYPFTDVGAYSKSSGPYGTFDQGGNAAEFTEMPVGDDAHEVRGGSWGSSFSGADLFAGTFFSVVNNNGSISIGFRIASVAVPEPATSILASVSLFFMMLVCRTRSTHDHN